MVSFVVTWQQSRPLSIVPGSIYGQRFGINSTSTGDIILSGTASEGEEMAAETSTIADADGLGVFSHTWLRDGDEISGANAGTYTLTQVDVGAEIAARVSYEDANGTVETLTSDPTAAVENVNNAPTIPSFSAVGGEFLIDVIDGYLRPTPAVTALSGGGYMVTWQVDQYGRENGIYGQRYDSAAMVEGDKFQVNKITDDSPGKPSVTGLAGGGVVVTWESQYRDGDSSGIFGQRYDSSGVVDGGEFQINTTTIDNWNYDPSVTALIEGGFVVTWLNTGGNASRSGVHGQIYDANGEVVGGDFLTNSSVTALSGGNFVAVWLSATENTDEFEFLGQIYDASGAVVGGEFLNDTTTGETQSGFSVTALRGGGFVVTRLLADQDPSGYKTHGQTYDASGAIVGGELSIDNTVGETLSNTTVTALSGGGFAVTWRSSCSIYGQVYDAAGAVVGGEFPIDNTTEGQQLRSSVTALLDGGFVVLWHLEGDDYDMNGQRYDAFGAIVRDGIYGQRYDATGAAVGGELAIDTADERNQSNSSLTVLNNGSFIVTWETNWVEGQGYQVFNRLYEPDSPVSVIGTPTQGETLNADTSLLEDTDGLGALSYQWQRDGAEISGATVDSHTLTQDDVGRQISLVVSYTDDQGTPEEVTSAATSAVVNCRIPDGSMAVS